MNYITQLLKQSVDKLVMLIVFSLSFYIIKEMPDFIRQGHNVTAFDFFSLFIAIFSFIASICTVFIFNLLPYNKKIATDLILSNQNTEILLPELLCFKNESQLELKFKGGTQIEGLLKKENIDGSKINHPMLDIDKIDINIKDKNGFNIPIKKYSYLSSNHVLSIVIKDKNDIKRAKTIDIKSKEPVKTNLYWNCFNKK